MKQHFKWYEIIQIIVYFSSEDEFLNVINMLPMPPTKAQRIALALVTYILYTNIDYMVKQNKLFIELKV